MCDEIKLLPTPDASVANYAEDPEEWTARAAKLKAKHNNGNGHGVPLAVEVKRLSRSAPASPVSGSSTMGSTPPASSTPGSASGTSGAGESFDSAGPASLFSMTSEGTGETPPGSMSSRAGSRARGRRPRASAKASATPRPFCGETCGGPLTSFDPATSSWRTLPTSSEPEGLLGMPSTDAYAAGLIDGEGCIYVDPRELRPRVEIGMSVKAEHVLRDLAEHYGGKVRVQKREGQRADMCRWVARGKGAEALLRQVAPYLRLKARQAALALEADSVHSALGEWPNGSKRWTPEAREAVTALRLEIMALNRKGPVVPTSAPAVGATAKNPAGNPLAQYGPRFSGTWPRSGSMSSGTVFPLRPSAPLTDVTGSSPLLPGPTSADGDRTSATYGRGNPTLPGAVKALLPTPRTSDQNGAGRHGQGGADLRTIVSEMTLLPTPHGMPREGQARNPGPTGNELGRAITLLPTPISNHGRQSTAAEPRCSRSTLNDVVYEWSGASTSPPSDDGKPSTAPRLSPWFVEWMIGAPPGWSDPACPLSATEFKSRSEGSPASTSCPSNESA